MKCNPDEAGAKLLDKVKEAYFERWTVIGWKQIDAADIKPYQVVRVKAPTGQVVFSGVIHCKAKIEKIEGGRKIDVHFWNGWELGIRIVIFTGLVSLFLGVLVSGVLKMFSTE